jgi:hypothetical protein
MSVAFTREESAETAAEVELPDRPISQHPNLVTALGLEALTNAMRDSRTAYDAAQRIEDAAERRRAVSVASRDMRYFADRLRTAQLVPPPADFMAVAFGHRATFRRRDGRRLGRLPPDPPIVKKRRLPDGLGRVESRQVR